MRRRFEVDVPDELLPGVNYTSAQLEAYADRLLKQDARSEVCADCGEPGVETGVIETIPQEITDGSGNPLVLVFEQVECTNEHQWFKGEGKARGIGGENPILFKDHLDARRRREIYTANGTPDPEIVSGMYNRTHPQGRKVNSEEQRRKHGASFFR